MFIYKRRSDWRISYTRRSWTSSPKKITSQRSEQFFSGVWLDTVMTIEEDLMRILKVADNIIHGHGVTSSVRTQFILGAYPTNKVCHCMEEYVEYVEFVSYTSAQHVD